MARVLYISIFNNSEEALLSYGVMKKINLHLKCLESYGNTVDYIYNDGINIYYYHLGNKIYLGKKKTSGYKYFNEIMRYCQKVIKQNNFLYDYIYIRHVAFSPRGFRALKYLSNRTKRIYLEFPTFTIPKKSIKNSIKYHYDKYLYKYVDKAVVDSLDEIAYKMPTLRIINGTDLKQICPKQVTNSDTINVLLMAYIQDYHGVDKIIKATNDYYKHNGKRNIVFHIVGNGPMLDTYKSEVEKNALDNHIIFYGNLNGKELDKVFDKCEIGISSLSNKEAGVTCSSTLKSKEYLAKGLPIISDTMLDVFVDNPKYFFYILKENFNISELLFFYDDVYLNRNKQKIIDEIREFANETCDMYKVFYGVHKDYLFSTSEKGVLK